MIHEKLRMKRAFLERSKWPYILYIFSEMKLLALRSAILTLFLPNNIQAEREIKDFTFGSGQIGQIRTSLPIF